MAGEAIWDGWEGITQTLNKFAWILTLVGGAINIIWGIYRFVVLLWWPSAAIQSLVSGIIMGSIAIVGAILFLPIAKQIKGNDYENINLIMLIITAVMAAIGCWYFFLTIPHLLIAIFICFLSEYGWIAKNK